MVQPDMARAMLSPPPREYTAAEKRTEDRFRQNTKAAAVNSSSNGA